MMVNVIRKDDILSVQCINFIDNEGILWQLDKDLNCRKIDDNITVSNGLHL